MTLSKTSAVTALTVLALMAGCATVKSVAAIPKSAVLGFTGQDQLRCLERAMYFESNRSSRDGMIAVGTVVMNRVKSSKFPNTVCKVVGQKNQFAPGVMTRAMNDSGVPLVKAAAKAVMSGESHPMVANAMFFHQAGYSFPYDNMHYVVGAGGNVFYEKRKRNLVSNPTPPSQTEGMTPTL